MAERKTRNGTRAGAKKEVPRRKVYSFDDMPAERDSFDLFGTLYEFAGPADISAQKMADIQRLPERVEELQRVQIEAEDEGERVRLGKEVLNALADMTRLCFATDIPDEVMRKITPRQHQFIHESFSKASSADGERLVAAMKATKEKDSRT